MSQGPSDTILVAIWITLRIRESKVRNPDPPDRRRFVLSECILVTTMLLLLQLIVIIIHTTTLPQDRNFRPGHVSLLSDVVGQIINVSCNP